MVTMEYKKKDVPMIFSCDNEKVRLCNLLIFQTDFIPNSHQFKYSELITNGCYSFY